MKVNGIENQTYHENMSGAKAKRKNKSGFYENLSENLNGQSGKSSDAKAGADTAAKTAANMTAGAVANKSYQYRNILSVAGISGTGNVGEGVAVREAKYISYQESDYVKAFAQFGFTLMAQVDVSARSVYIEQKTEDGTIKGYDVDMDNLNSNTKDPIEQMALEAWEKVKSNGESEEASDNTELTVEEALLRFYEFIEDRIKNGPPKYMIGSSEFSIEEWEKFLKSIDGQLDDIREEMRERIERLKEQQEEQQLQALFGQRNNGVPYGYLAKDGIIDYNGVIFVCDEKHKALHLGDTSNPKNCLNIPLSGGGSLIVNRDNLDDLAKAIGMFSPEDVNIIMRAIAQDAKVQQMKHQIDDETSGVDLANETDAERAAEKEIEDQI